jgi:hypothetical protein
MRERRAAAYHWFGLATLRFGHLTRSAFRSGEDERRNTGRDGQMEVNHVQP